MLRALLLEYPEDPTSWLIEDEYLFGGDLLVAPLLEDTPERDLYLPPGGWIDYQTGDCYEGARWHRVAAGAIPILLMVRDGAVVPHIGLAQSTAAMDWTQIELRVYANAAAQAKGLIALPADGVLRPVSVAVGPQGCALQDDPLPGRVQWRITRPACGQS
jgi:alpha-D-xyloside xylohydrolase